MNAITNFLYNVLAYITNIVNNYGVSIIIFTFLMRLICMPFDYRSRKGMRKMTLLQPELDKLQKKYGNDTQKFQQKQAELMRREHYNPLSGCLPLLLTWPLMIAMFAAMRAIANEQLALQVFRYLAGEAEVVMPADRFLWIKNIWMTDSPFASIAPDAQSLQLLSRDVWQKACAMLSDAQLSAAAQTLSVESTLDALRNCFESDAAMKASVATLVNALGQIESYQAAVATVPGWSGLNFFLFSVSLYQNYNGLLILPILAGVSQILTTKLMPQQQQQPQADSQQKGMNGFMKWFFPILSIYFCLSSNAGFAIYWVTSNVVAGVQSVVINKMLEHQDKKKQKTFSGEGSVK